MIRIDAAKDNRPYWLSDYADEDVPQVILLLDSVPCQSRRPEVIQALHPDRLNAWRTKQVNSATFLMTMTSN